MWGRVVEIEGRRGQGHGEAHVRHMLLSAGHRLLNYFSSRDVILNLEEIEYLIWRVFFFSVCFPNIRLGQILILDVLRTEETKKEKRKKVSFLKNWYQHDGSQSQFSACSLLPRTSQHAQWIFIVVCIFNSVWLISHAVSAWIIDVR